MKDLGVLLPHELPHVWDGHEVDGWGITGYYNDKLTCRSALFYWLLGLPLQGFPDGKDTAEVIAYVCERGYASKRFSVEDDIAMDEWGYDGPMPYNRPLYRADVRIPVNRKGE